MHKRGHCRVCAWRESLHVQELVLKLGFHLGEGLLRFSALLAAFLLDTDHFVNVVEGGGMIGYEAILRTLELMRDAYLQPKDMRSLVQIKGWGCEGCL